MLRFNRMQSAVVAALLLTFLVGGAANCSAQLTRRNEAEDPFLLAPRALQRMLNEGRQAIEEQRYTDGISALSFLLDPESPGLPADLRGQDFFIERGRAGHYTQTLRDAVRQLLADLPPAGREVLEIELGVPAQLELEQAVASRSLTKLENLPRRYPHTLASYDATVLLAEQKLKAGFPTAAANLFQSLLDYPTARGRYGPELVRAAAMCWVAASRPQMAEKTLEYAIQDFPNQAIFVGGQTYSISADTSWKDVIAQLETELSVQTDYRNDDQWMQAGGAASRNAVSQAGMPLPSARWVTEIHSNVPEKEGLLKLAESERQAERVILPKFEARMLGDLLFTKTTGAEILAVDFATGITKWPFYHGSSPARFFNHRFQSAAAVGGELSDELKSRVWGDSAFGRFSGDEQFLYYTGQHTQGRVGAGVNRNVLQGISISGEGKIVWSVGDDESDEPSLVGAYFLGPPLSYEGELFVICEQAGETKLVALEPTTGKLRWSQQLIHPQFRQLRYDVGRRSQAISPTIAEGIILCPTGAGALVAVDLITHNLRWGVTYSSDSKSYGQSAIQRGVFGASIGGGYNPLDARWHDASLFVHNGMVVFSPPEGNLFMGRDLLTGKRIFANPRGSARYLAGVDDNILVVVGETSAVGIDLNQLKRQWETEFPDRRKIAGRGLWQDGAMLLPLTERMVIRLDTATGELLDSTEVDQPLGSLFAHRGQLISASATSVSVYYTEDQLRDEVETRLAENAKDTWALNQKSQLAVAEGNSEDAYRLLEQSYRVDPSNADTRYLLVEVLLKGLQQDYVSYRDRAEKYRSVVEFGPQRFRFLQWLAMGSIEEKDLLAAYDFLMQLLDERSGTSYASAPAGSSEMKLSELHSVNTDSWIATQLARSYQLATEEQRRVMDSRVAARMDSIRNVVLPLRWQTLKYFLWHPSAVGPVIDTAIALLEREDQVAAERILQPLLYHPDKNINEMALKLLAKRTTLDTARLGPRGIAFLSSLYRANDLENLVSEADVSDELMSPIPWAEGLFELVDSRSPQELYPNGERLPITSQRYGRPDLDLRLAGGYVNVLNANGEDVVHLEYNRSSADNSNALRRAVVRGGLLIIETSSEVIGMDLYLGATSRNQAMLWRQSLLFPAAGPQQTFQPAKQASIENTAMGVQLAVRDLGSNQSRVGPLTAAGLVVQIASDLVCLDAYSGRQMWKRGGYDHQISFAWQAEQLAIVNPSMGQIEWLDARDGSLIKSEPLKQQRAWKYWSQHGAFIVDYAEVVSEGSAVHTKSNLRPVVRVWSPFNEREIVLDMPRGSKANLVEGRHLIAVDRDGELHWIDLGDGNHKQFDVQISQDLRQLNGMRFGDSLVVFGDAVVKSARTRIPNLAEMVPREFEPVNGELFVIDLQSKQLRFDKPINLHSMFVPVNQPRNSPFLFSYRINASSVDAGGPAGPKASIAILDLRSGQLAYGNDHVPLNAPMGFAMLLQPRGQGVEISLGGKHFQFRATDRPRPPSPMASFGALSDSEPLIRRLEQLDYFR